MISFLTSAKSFTGNDRNNQLRAIKSWLVSVDNAEVILYGRTEGAEEISNLLGVKYIPDIESTKNGVPYFSAIADHAKHHALYDTQIYVNCDIMLSDSIVNAVNAVKFSNYLMIGQRIDLHEDAEFNFDGIDWPGQLIQLMNDKKVSLHLPSGKDYFIFPRGVWDGIPSFVVGRVGYDDGLLDFCFYKKIPIIDATYDILAIHQFHGFSHLPGGQKEYLEGPEAQHNSRLLITTHSSTLVSDANWILRSGKLKKSYARGDFVRYTELVLKFKLKMLYGSFIIRAIWRFLGVCKIYLFKRVEIEEVLEGHALLASNKHLP